MTKTTSSKIALYGGSFDPVHHAHLGVARAALAAGIDEVVFIPAANAPLKTTDPGASDVDRLQMLKIALSGQEGCSVDDWEIRQGGVSYTIDTLLHYRARRPQAELLLIIGGDQFVQLDRWHRIEDLLQNCSFLVAARPGHHLIEPAVSGLKWMQLEAPLSGVSSTKVRQRLAEGGPPDESLPAAVEAFIREKELYR